MAKTIKIKKGYNIQLVGEANLNTTDATASETYALKPTDFPNLTPKLLLREGAEVKAGDAVFCDKDRPDILFCSPISGEITEVKRGDKRKILEIIILADKEVKYKDFGKVNAATMNRDAVKKHLIDGGVWPLLVERPFGVVADPAYAPVNIFITGINSAPLAADVNYIAAGQEKQLQAGIDALAKLTDGKVYLSLDADKSPTDDLKNLKGVDINYFSGDHPKGNPGVQMHHLAPLNKGERAYTVNISDLIIIGRLFTEGRLNMLRTVALAGAAMKKPQYTNIIVGANLKNLSAQILAEGNNRLISGNVLTGKKVNADGYLGFFSTEITAIPENGDPDFLGWILPGFDRFSLSRTFWSWLKPSKKYNLDTHMHGEERAFVMTGIYERVFPFDIYPVQLIKSIMTKDIEKMEQLGIYEVIDEDFALCEVVCPSKIEVQTIVREGLDYMRQEVN